MRTRVRTRGRARSASTSSSTARPCCPLRSCIAPGHAGRAPVPSGPGPTPPFRSPVLRQCQRGARRRRRTGRSAYASAFFPRATCGFERSRSRTPAFLDDTYVVSARGRTGERHGALEDALWRHARIRLHQGKIRVWNAAGEEPSGLARLQPVGADSVWTGAWSLPADQRWAHRWGVQLSCAVSSAANARSKN